MSAPETKPPGKKPYQPPVLEVYGSVREMTRALVLSGNKNDMSGGPNKTG
jgi:hypothetical protein